MSRINNEVYDSIRDFDRQEIRKKVVAELRDELRQEVYDEVVDELGKVCAVCHVELDTGEEDEEDQDPIVQSAMVVGDQLMQPQPIPLPPSPFGLPPIPNGWGNGGFNR